MHEVINFILNKEEMPQQWMEPIILNICRKDDAADCNNY
jgi:hypothetical protein